MTDTKPHLLILSDSDGDRVLFYKESFQAAQEHLWRVEKRMKQSGFTGKIYELREVKKPA